MSFIYDLGETFYFPDEIVKYIYQKYLIEKVYVYHVLTDTDSTCLKFVFVSSTDNNILDKKFRDIICEVFVASENYNRFDSSKVYCEEFGVRKENLIKCLGYFEIEHIGNRGIATNSGLWGKGWGSGGQGGRFKSRPFLYRKNKQGMEESNISSSC